MITGISGPLAKWRKVIKGQATPAFFIPFLPRRRKMFQILLKTNKDTELHCYLFPMKVSLQQACGTQEAMQFCLGIVSGNYTVLKSMPEL